MSISHHDDSSGELSEPDDFNETTSQAGSEPVPQPDDVLSVEDEGDDESDSPDEENVDEKWVKDFRKNRQMLDDAIRKDMRLENEVWNSQKKDEKYKKLLEECLRLEKCRRPLPKPEKDEALGTLQFIIKTFYKIHDARMGPNLTMANTLVRLIIKLVEDIWGSDDLLSVLQATSDTKAVSKEPKAGGVPSNFTLHDKQQTDNWDENSSPLFMAIELDRKAGSDSRGLTVFICETLPEAARKTALAAKDKDNKSWLHAALLADLEGVEKMIQWAPVSVFCEGRKADGPEDGNTPLHDALDYRNHKASFPKCLGTQWELQPQPAEFAPKLTTTKQSTPPLKKPCSTCVAAAQHFQNSWVRWDNIVKGILRQDIRTLREHNASGRSPYLYYLYTRDRYPKTPVKNQGPTSSNVHLPVARIESVDPRKETHARARSLNPKSYDDANPEKKNNETDQKNSEEGGKPSGSSKNTDSKKKSDDNKKLGQSKTSTKEPKAGYGPNPPKKLQDNSKIYEATIRSDNSNSGSTPDTQPSKKTVQFLDHRPDLISEGNENSAHTILSTRPIRRNSQVFGPESRQSNTAIRRPSARSSKSKTMSHKESNLEEEELTVGLDTLLKETAYAVGDYEEAFECLFRKQSDDNDIGTDEEDRLQSWYLEKKEVRISMNTTRDFNFFNFEPMLSTVRIDLHDTGSDQELEKSTEQEKISRWNSVQEHLIGVFRWLKEDKGVKGIMRLVVLDREPIYCSDETMEQCLKDLEVRYLNWNRPDICTDTLQLTRDLVQVDLYWSGLKAVLCSWGDTNGLRTLKRLRHVNLHAEKGRETEQRMDDYVKQFKDKAVLEWQRTEGKAKLPEISGGYPNTTSHGEKQNVDPKTGAPKNDSHPWFKEATLFATQLRNMTWTNLEELKVKVAVIDDGVSPTYQSVGKYLHHPGWPCKGERAQENFASTNGHGSKMAYLITEICPFAEIYVVKLDADTPTFRERSFNLHSAKKAVRWAASQGVDIISMSWNVRRTEKTEDDLGNEAEVKELETAINSATTDQNILIYCAAGDQKGGMSKSMKWVPCDLDNTISIGATDIHGTKKSWVVDNERLGYLLPGENILKEPNQDWKDVGNSGATALAAGLAAMVLFFSKANGIDIEQKSVRHYMERVFRSVFNATADNNKVVQVHGVLGTGKSKQDRFKDKLIAVRTS